MHLPLLPRNTKDLLEFLRSQPSTDPQSLLSTYTQALTLLTDDIHSLFVFLDYINLSLNCSEMSGMREEALEEIEHLYSLFKVKLRKFRIFWINYLKFQVESRNKSFESAFAKIIEYLKLKAFDGKDEIMNSIQNEKNSLQSELVKKERPLVEMAQVEEINRSMAPREEINRSITPREDINRSVKSAICSEEDSGQNISTNDLVSSNIFTDGSMENMKNTAKNDDLNKFKEPSKEKNIEKREKKENSCMEGATSVIKTLLSTPSGIKTWSDAQNKSSSLAIETNIKSPEIANIIDKEKETENEINKRTSYKDNGTSVMFELELSRPNDTAKLRFSPNKHTPFRREVDQTHEKRFVDIFSISQDRPHENNTANNIGMAYVPFKDKELFLIGKIGKGGYSTVYRVYYGDEIFALKQIRVEDNESLGICMDEINLLKKLNNCEFVIKMIDYDIRDSMVSILLEYGETDLQNLIKSEPLNIFYIKYIWESILKILVFIHSNKIVHRDIKPANFVLVKGKIKIIDFGISKSIKGDTTSILNFEKAGTLNYISPEQCSGRKVSRATDVWAAGCILYYMIYRKNIHNGKSVMDVLRMMSEETRIEYGPADGTAIESIQACLIYDSKKRAKAEELLQYAFLKDG